jgi:peptidoglycan/LPS O-acetylase OafA/YrhL
VKFDWDRRLGLSENNCFDVMRLVLATLVIFEHSYFLPINSPVSEPLFRFSGGQIHFGAMAVYFFFVISGFLITRSWETTASLLRYLQKRVARIFPGFLIASCAGILIGALSVQDIGTYFLGINLRAFLQRVLTLHSADPLGAFPNNPMSGIVGGTLWSIRYEFDCYLLVALFGTLGWLRRGPITIVFIALAATYMAQRFGGLELPSWDYGIPYFLFSSPSQWPHLFTYFFAGAAFYLWRDYLPRSPIIFILAIVLLIFALRYGGAEQALAIAGTYCILFISLSFAATPRLFGERVDLSYGAYLFGFPIQQLIICYSSRSISPVLLFLTSFSITCFIAYVSWRFIESPCLRWKWPKRSPAVGSEMMSAAAISGDG